REVHSEPDAPVGPRRLRLPLLGEHEPLRERGRGGLEREPGRPLELLGQGTADRVGDVRLAALEHRQARGLVGHRLEDQPPHARGLPPVWLERLEDELDARSERYEPVRPAPDRRVLETVVADPLNVPPPYEPSRADR